MASQNADHADSDQPTCRSRRHEPGTAPLLTTDMRICPPCREILEETLIELPTLFDLCASALELRPNGLRERVSGHRPHGIVLRDTVVSVRAEILGVLAAWCGLVKTEREVPGPDELAIRKLVGFLGIHLHWLCQHVAAADFVDELTDLTAAVSGALRPESGFRVAVGTCLHPKCGRVVYAEAHHEGAAPYEVACEAGHVWAPEHWLALRGRTNGNGHASGSGSGQANGHVNGNAHANGRTNGRRNGNGHPNGGKTPDSENAE